MTFLNFLLGSYFTDPPPPEETTEKMGSSTSSPLPLLPSSKLMGWGNATYWPQMT